MSEAPATAPSNDANLDYLHIKSPVLLPKCPLAINEGPRIALISPTHVASQWLCGHHTISLAISVRFMLPQSCSTRESAALKSGQPGCRRSMMLVWCTEFAEVDLPHVRIWHFARASSVSRLGATASRL